MAKTDENIVIQLTHEASHGFGHIYASTLVQNNGLSASHDQGRLLSPSLGDRFDWRGKYGYLENLRVTGLYDESEPERVYGWNIEYSSHMFIRQDEAEVMLKTLRRLNRDMDKLTNQLGYADTFGEYVARFALILGCVKFCVREREITANGTPYRWFDAQGMRYWISDKCKPAKANA